MMTPTTQSLVLAKFVGKEILGEMGRLLFGAIASFQGAGLEIQLFDNLRTDEFGKYGPLVFTLPHVASTSKPPIDVTDAIYVFDEEDAALARLPWRKRVQIRFDVFSPHWLKQPIIMPYPVHPTHAGPDLPERLQRCRSRPKTMRAFFSGDTEGYLRNRIHYPEVKLTRSQVVDIVQHRLAGRVTRVTNPKEMEAAIANGSASRRFVIAEPKSMRIDPTDWLETLAEADFFLCPPGYVMPMCHNIIEAMAVGAIPITNYPEWLDPHLRHGENCISFTDEEDLVAKIEDLLSMSDADIAEMRKRVLQYYSQYLTSESFVRRVLSHPDRKVVVLMITDANVAANATKLNGRSVMMRGTTGVGTPGWRDALRLLLQR